jgi:hypothetical protein
MASAPSACSGACGPKKARATAADTRPCMSGGVLRCAKLSSASYSQGSANPRTTEPATASGSELVARIGQPPDSRRASRER